MTTRHVIDSFWSAMQANEWTAAAEHFADDCLIDWPCSGERVRSPQAYAELQARYPTDTGVWSFDIHQIVCEGDTAVSEVTVSDGEQAATGYMNNATVQAISYLQRDAHLPQTGRLNAATENALNSMLANGNNQMGGNTNNTDGNTMNN